MPRLDLTRAMLDAAARERDRATRWPLDRPTCPACWTRRRIVATRTAAGGAAPPAVDGDGATSSRSAEQAVRRRRRARLAGFDGGRGRAAGARPRLAGEAARPDRARSDRDGAEHRRRPDAAPARSAVVNVGLPLFADAVGAQGRPVASVDWRIPAGGDPDAGRRARDGSTAGDRPPIDAANAEVLRRLDTGVPLLVGGGAGRRRGARARPTARCCTAARRSS